SFDVRPGTTHAVVGESGSGKTTTGRMISLFETPTAGSITVGGKDILGPKLLNEKSYAAIFSWSTRILTPRWIRACASAISSLSLFATSPKPPKQRRRRAQKNT